jgi:hypothetical protein
LRVVLVPTIVNDHGLKRQSHSYRHHHWVI